MRDTVAGFDVKKRTTWHVAKLPEVTYHQACTKPDVQSEADFQRLLSDIKQNGIREPILVQASSGAVFAGRHRIKAAKEAGVPIPVIVLEISDAECWSYSRSQLCHRNLSPTRAATLFVEMQDGEAAALKAQAKESDKEEEADEGEGEEKKGKKAKAKAKAPKKDRAKKGEGKKTKKEAKEAGVSQATMERVRKVKKEGIPAIWKAMDAGDINAGDAAYIVDFPHDVQRAALALVKDGSHKTLKSAHSHLEKEAKKAEGPTLRDGRKQEVPKKLMPVFEDRGQFTVLRENVIDLGKSFAKLLKRESAKHIPKEMATHLEDIATALDIYQPFAVDEKSEDGWITKRDANK